MCTTQLVKLQRRLPELAAEGAAVFAVSSDPPEQARKVTLGSQRGHRDERSVGVALTMGSRGSGRRTSQ
jgi:hypothetical protein